MENIMSGSDFEDDSTFEGGDGSILIDLSNIEDTGFELLPKGTYPCTIESCEYGMSQNSGQPMWTLKLNVTEGPYEGRKLFTHLSFSPKALPVTKRSLAAIAPELLSGPFNPEVVASDMEGKSVRAEVAIEKYQGENRNRVRTLKAAGSSDAFIG
jgi:hypothetical protein